VDHHLPQELVLVEGGALAQCAGGGDGAEADGGDAGGEGDPGSDGAMGRFLGSALRGGTLRRQVGEQGGQFVPGAGGQGLPGSLVEFVGGDPAGLEGLGQLAEGPIAVGVGYPDVTGG
jgi:hypothetical protein